MSLASTTTSSIAPLQGYFAFLQVLMEYLEGRSGESENVGLLIIQLTNLNRINTAAGYRVGHRVSVEFSRRLESMLRVNDWVTTISDNRFALVLDQVKNPGLLVLAANRIQRFAAALSVSDNLSSQLEVRVGAAIFPEHGNCAEKLLRNAELAVETAAIEKSVFSVFNAEESKQLTHDWDIEAEFDIGLENSEFELYYQPKVDARTLLPCGAEGLIRWHNPRIGAFSIERFIQIIEATDRIDALTNFVLHSAARDLTEWPSDSGNPTVAINLAPSVIEHGNLVASFKHVAAIWGVEVDRFTAEVTENGIISSTGPTLDVLQELRDAGIRVSIDDFGTGNSSLAYFKDIPADELKIDKSFVFGMLENEANHRLVKTIIDLAHGFDLKVVAEGVENADCVAELQQLGCDVFQGYHFARPMPQRELVDFLGQQNKNSK